MFNGTGCGISALQPWGDVSISDSVIAFNSGNIDYTGGNILIYLSGVTSWKRDSAVLTIESCTIAFGHSTYPQLYSLGHEIHVPYLFR